MKPYYDQGGTTIFCGDCREILSSLKADVVVTDPPFGIPVGAAFVRRGGADVHDGDDPANATDDPYWWIALVGYVRCVAFFVDRATACVAEQRARLAGLKPFAKFYLVKTAPPPTPRPTFVSSVEECIIAERDSRVWIRFRHSCGAYR